MSHPKFKCNMLSKMKSVKVLLSQSCPTLCDPTNCSLPGSSVHGKNSCLGKNTGVGCHFLLQEISPTGVFCIAGRLFTIWAIREALSKNKMAQMIEWVLTGEELRAWMMPDQMSSSSQKVRDIQWKVKRTGRRCNYRSKVQSLYMIMSPTFI